MEDKSVTKLNKKIATFKPVDYNQLILSLKYNVFDDSINLKNLTSDPRNNKSFMVLLSKVDGFRLKASPLILAMYTDFMELYFRFVYFSTVRNKDNHNPINSSSANEIVSKSLGKSRFKSVMELLNHFNDGFNGLFSFKMDLFTLDATNHFKYVLSPVLFKNAQFKLFRTFRFTNTTIRKYFLQFIDNDDLLDSQEVNDVDLNSVCYDYYLINSYNIRLNSHLLNKHVFRLLFSIVVSFSSLAPIETNLFKSFLYLKRLTLELNNFREFWHMSTNNNQWLLSLNFRVSFNIDPKNKYDIDAINFIRHNRFKLDVIDKHTNYINYDYPDEDICLFVNFLNDRLIHFSWIIYQNHFNIKLINTCTLAHLGKNLDFFLRTIDNTPMVNVWMSETIMSMCSDIEQRIANCKVSDFLNKTDRFSKQFNEDDLTYVLTWLELIGPIITFPIVAFIGFLTNALIILVILNKINKTLFLNKSNKRVYQYMAANSVFSMNACILSIFTLLSECLGTGSLYCSMIMDEYWVINFKIYIVSYLGEVMKTCSLLTMLALSFERYIITTNSRNGCLLSLNTNKFSYQMIIVLLFSFATSYCKVNEYIDSIYYLPQLEFPMLNLNNMLNKPESSFFLLMLYLLHYVLNDLVILVVNLAINVELIKEIRKEFQAPSISLSSISTVCETVYAGEEPVATAAVVPTNEEEVVMETTQSAVLSETQSIAQYTEEVNLNKMIIYTFMLFLVCRLPELVVYLYPLMPFYNAESEYTYMPFAINIIQYLYVCSYSTNIIFYLKFNKQFNDDFKQFFSIKSNSSNNATNNTINNNEQEEMES